jgi:hypothetical protein
MKSRVNEREVLNLAERVGILTGGDATRMDGTLRIRVLAERVLMMV